MTKNELIEILWSHLLDFEKHGTLWKLDPTIPRTSDLWVLITFYTSYLRGMDESVRSKAGRILYDLNEEKNRLLSKENG